MYQYVWNKFLPVIAMKLKTAVKKREPQQLEIDKLDFERASDKKNAKYQFKLEMNEGRTIRSKDNSAIALDFARALNEFEVTKEILKTGVFKFNMNTKFILTIDPNFPAAAAEAVTELPSETTAETPAESPEVTPVESPEETPAESPDSTPAPTQAETSDDSASH